MIQLKRGTAAQWTTANPVLGAGQPGVETDTLKWKIGDGVTAWASLAYAGAAPAAWGSLTGSLSSQADLVAALTGKQPASTILTGIAGLAGSTADWTPYFAAGDTPNFFRTTTYTRSLLDDGNAASAQTTLGLVIGADVAAQVHTHPAADISDSTPAGRGMLTAADAAAQTALLNPATTALKGLVPAPVTATGKYLKDDLTWATVAGLSDGDKGDITVTGSGATWTIDAGVISLAKMANMATGNFLGRTTAGSGAPEVLSPAAARSLLNVADGATAIPNTDSLAEGTTNLWFTAARVRSTVLTGLSLASSAVIAATDTVLAALGQLQAQITLRLALAGGTMTGLLSTAPATTGGAGLNIGVGVNPSAPVDGDIWITTTYLAYRLNGTIYSAVGLNGSQTVTGKKTFAAATISSAFFSLAHGVAPTAPVDGDIWTTTQGLFAQINGVTKRATPLSGAATITLANNATEFEGVVSAPGVVPSSIIMLSVAPHLDSDENAADLLDIVAMSGLAGTDQITIVAGFYTPSSGDIKLNWSAA